MYKFIFAAVCCNLLLLSGCASLPDTAQAQPAITKDFWGREVSTKAMDADGHETAEAAQACAAVKQAILAYQHAAQDSTFGPCNASDGPHYLVGVAINVPHTDEHGIYKLDTFYYGDALLDPATHEIKVTSLVHN